MLNEQCQIVFEFIKQYKTDTDGVAPSIREITESCQISSTSQTNKFLRSLQESGLIRYDRGQARTIRVIGGKWTFEGNGQLSSVNSSKSVN